MTDNEGPTANLVQHILNAWRVALTELSQDVVDRQNAFEFLRIRKHDILPLEVVMFVQE